MVGFLWRNLDELPLSNYWKISGVTRMVPNLATYANCGIIFLNLTTKINCHLWNQTSDSWRVWLHFHFSFLVRLKYFFFSTFAKIVVKACFFKKTFFKYTFKFIYLKLKENKICHRNQCKLKSMWSHAFHFK